MLGARYIIICWGLVVLVWSFYLFFKVIYSPGDDNPVVFLFLISAASSVLPLTGILRIRKAPSVGWLIASSVLLSTGTFLLSLFV